MSSSRPSFESELQRLRQLRLAILRIHKAMLESERSIYEEFHGPIRSNTEFFNLVIEEDGWFSWLRPISQFVVQIDDVVLSKKPVSMEQVDELFNRARVLMQPSEFGTELEKGYFRAIQRSPEIALMHAEVSRLMATPDA
jgi:hypothetical protein